MTSQQIRDAALKGHTCCAEVWSGMGWFKCRCAAKVFRDGKPYCRWHDPVKVAEKKAAADALREKAARLRACERAVVEAAMARWMLSPAASEGETADAEKKLEDKCAALMKARGVT